MAPHTCDTAGLDEPHDIPLSAIEQAATTIAGRVARTPMLSSRSAAQAVREVLGVDLGAGVQPDGTPRVFCKAEHLQVTGSFKPRGAVNRVAALTPDERARGLVTL